MQAEQTRTRYSSAVDCDLVIVGAGPTGLFATYYAGFRGFKVVVVGQAGKAVDVVYDGRAVTIKK